MLLVFLEKLFFGSFSSRKFQLFSSFMGASTLIFFLDAVSRCPVQVSQPPSANPSPSSADPPATSTGPWAFPRWILWSPDSDPSVS